MGWILSIVKWLLGLWLKTPPQPSQEAVQAKEAGAATQAAQDLQKGVGDAESASNAASSVDQSIADPAGLRKYESTDPNARP